MCILTTALGLLQVMSHRSILALQVQDFSKGYNHCLKLFR